VLKYTSLHVFMCYCVHLIWLAYFLGLYIDLIERETLYSRREKQEEFNIAPKTTWSNLPETVSLLTCRLFSRRKFCVSVRTKVENFRRFTRFLLPNTGILS
jgi:hypothetical protein